MIADVYIYIYMCVCIKLTGLVFSFSVIGVCHAIDTTNTSWMRLVYRAIRSMVKEGKNDLRNS